jgi:hypothetical protein
MIRDLYHATQAGVKSDSRTDVERKGRFTKKLIEVLGPDVRHDAWVYEGPSGGRLSVIAAIRSGDALGEARRRGRQNLDDG